MWNSVLSSMPHSFSPDQPDPLDEALRRLGTDAAKLRRLGIDPIKFPPPPHTRIDIDEADVPEKVRGSVSVTFGDPQTRVSVKIDGISPDAAEEIRNVVMDRKLTTRDAIMHALKTLEQ